MVARVLVGKDRKLDGEVLITVAEFRHGQLFSVPPRITVSKLIRRLEYFHHVVGVCVLLTGSFNQQVGVIRPKAEELLGSETGADLELNTIISLFYGVSPNLEDSSALIRLLFNN